MRVSGRRRIDEVAHRGGVRSCTSTTPRDSRQVNATGTNPALARRLGEDQRGLSTVTDTMPTTRSRSCVGDTGSLRLVTNCGGTRFGGGIMSHSGARLSSGLTGLNRVVYLADDDGRTLGRGRKWPARKAGAEPQPDVHPGEPDPAGADEALAGEKHVPASRTRVRVRSVLTTAAT